MAEAVIRLHDLTKSYGTKRGIERVTLDVERGEVFGFLGPNGAGKTTTIRTMLDLLHPTSGRAEVFGLDSREGTDEIHARTGYLPGELGLAERMTVRQQLQFFANLRGGVPWERVESLATRFDLDMTRIVRNLSRGNKQKVGVIQAFMHEPELLVLDEPTGGLDPLMQQEFNDLVRETVARGATIFLSSHILPEVETLCERVAIIREGSVVAVEDVATVKRRAVRKVRATFSTTPNASILDGVPHASDAKIEGMDLVFNVQGEAGDAVRALAVPGLVDLTVHDPTLEDVFLGYYGRGNGQ